MWLREFCQAVVRNDGFWPVVFLLFMAQLFLIGSVEQERIRGRQPKLASNLYVLTLALPFLSVFTFIGRPFPEPFSYMTGCLLLFTGPTVIFARSPGHFGFPQPLAWFSRFLALAYSILLIIFLAR